MGLQRFPISGFSGGLNTSSGPHELEPNEAQDLLNVTLTPRGSLKQREGKTRFDTGGFPADKRVDHMRLWYKADGTKLLLLSIDGDIYSSTNGGALTLRFDGTAGSVWCFEVMPDSTGTEMMWAMNGVDAAQKWNGSAANTSAWANSPPAGSMLRVWRNRMIVSGRSAKPQRVYYSDIGNPEAPNATYGEAPAAGNWLDLRTSEDDLDAVTWLELLGDQLLVFKRRSTWTIHDPATMSPRMMGRPGAEARFQSAVSGNKAYFFHDDGVYATNGIVLEYESEAISTWFEEHLTHEHIEKVRMASFNRRIFLAVPTGSSIVNNRLLELIPDLRARVRSEGRPLVTSGPWVMHDYPVSAMCEFRPIHEDQLVAGDSGDDKIHLLFEGTNDDGVAINAYWMSGWKSLISEEPFERVRRLNLEMSGRVVVQVYKDFEETSSFSAVLETQADPDPLWDGGVWDGGVWTPQGSTELKRARPETRGRYHAVKLSNNVADKTFIVYAAEIALRGGKEH